MACEVRPESVGVPTIETLDTRVLATDLTESTCAVDDKRRFGLDRGAGSDVFDRNHIPFGGENSLLDVGLVSVPDINTVALSEQGKEQFGDRSFNLETGKEKLYVGV